MWFATLSRSLIWRQNFFKTWPLLFSISYYQFYYAQDVSTFSLHLHLPQLRKYIFTTLLLKMITRYHLLQQKQQNRPSKQFDKRHLQMSKWEKQIWNNNKKKHVHNSMLYIYPFNLLMSITHISTCFLPFWGERMCNTSLILGAIWGEWLVNGKQHYQSWDGSLWFITMCFH